MTLASLAKAETELRAWSLGFPEAAEEFPWGERVIKVRGKIFVFLGTVEKGLRVGVKLPQEKVKTSEIGYASLGGVHSG